MKIIPAIIFTIPFTGAVLYATFTIEFTCYIFIWWLAVLTMYIPIFKIVVIPAFKRIPFNAPRWYRIRVYKQIYANISFMMHFQPDNSHGLCQQFDYKHKVSVFEIKRFPELMSKKNAWDRKYKDSFFGTPLFWFKDNETRLKWLDRQIKRLQK